MSTNEQKRCDTRGDVNARFDVIELFLLRASGAFAECPLVMSFFKYLQDDYLDCDFVRAIARVCFTDLVGECSRLGSEVVNSLSVVGCSPDDNTISQYVHLAAISRGPLQLHLMAVS